MGIKKAVTLKLPIDLIKEIKTIAEQEKRPFSSQIEFMLERDLHGSKQNLLDIMYASESSLAKDWLKEEEEQAWQDL